MNYNLVKSTVDLVAEFESINANGFYKDDIQGFQDWIVDKYTKSESQEQPLWDGKEKGRSAESVISTLLVHMNRYAKNYSKSAIAGSDFSTQEDFIYLINLKAFGSMTKMDLIKKNVHEKPVGMLIIHRLMEKGWIEQQDSAIDKRSKVISISESGKKVLDAQMDKIRQATNIVCGNLSEGEKLELIRLLNKLNDFHLPIYEKNLNTEKLLEEASLYKN